MSGNFSKWLNFIIAYRDLGDGENTSWQWETSQEETVWTQYVCGANNSYKTGREFYFWTFILKSK